MQERCKFFLIELLHPDSEIVLWNIRKRVNLELRRCRLGIRIFPNEESCKRLIQALAVESHENWIEAHRYLKMQALR